MQNLKSALIPLKQGPESDFSALLDAIGEASIVFMGEATHGTHEFYKARAELSKQLIKQKGFTSIAVEADWANAYEINKYIKKYKDVNAVQALERFKNFPLWMWQNTAVLELITWLYNFNAKRSLESKIGFYGLDLYSLYESAHDVIEYLDTIDKTQADIARERYACFDRFGHDVQKYGYFVTHNLSIGCQNEVREQIQDLVARKVAYLKKDGFVAHEEFFCAEQNALLVQDAELYYRLVFSNSYTDSWNFRDRHMMRTLVALHEFEKKLKKKSKVIVWAHNSHIGDARFTSFAQESQLNLGQLARDHFGNNAFLIGFTTDHGTVSAASSWGGITERKNVRPALPGSYEHLFHTLDAGDFLLLLKGQNKRILEPMLERAIGVIYAPATERMSHYFDADMQQQFDAIIHFDKTCAVEPLKKTSAWDAGELPETYPTGI